METLYTHEIVSIEPRVKVCTVLKPIPKGHIVFEGEGGNVENCRWILARPENAKSLVWRIKAAMHVLAGRAVPLEWR